MLPEIAKFPVLFPVSREIGNGDGFDNDCVRHHALFRTARFPGYLQMARSWRASALTFCLCGDQFRPRRDFWRAVSVPRNRRSRRSYRKMRVVSPKDDLEAEHSPLARPLSGQVAHPRDAMAVRETPFDCGLDKVGG